MIISKNYTIKTSEVSETRSIFGILKQLDKR